MLPAEGSPVQLEEYVVPSSNRLKRGVEMYVHLLSTNFVHDALEGLRASRLLGEDDVAYSQR